MMKARSSRTKRKPGLYRPLYKIPPRGLPLFETISFNWSNTENVMPTSLFYGNWNGVTEVSVNNVILETTEASKNILEYLNCVKLVFNEKTTQNILYLDVYPKQLPLLNAETMVCGLFNKVSSFVDEIPEDSAWDGLIKELVATHEYQKISGYSCQHADLKPTLRGYQASAVSWMLKRESAEVRLNLDWISEVADILNLPNDKTMLYNKYTKTLFEPIESTIIRTGGILADEMGLGKTVITLALILNNPRISVPSWEKIKHNIDDVDCSDLSSDEDLPSQRQMNLEGSLNANEKLQLVPTKPGRGILKKQLTSWYESQLAAFTPKRKKRRRLRATFKCICGDEVGKNKKVVKCCCCELKQHAKCVGYEPEMSDYICPACWKTQNLVPSRATLIVTPPAIFQQWGKEIENHAPALKTYLYSGERDRFIQPKFLSDFDVVITTFLVLRSQTVFGAEQPERALRNESRFLRQTCPLECIAWYRVVCDEAQMFESDVSIVRAMINRLNAVHRWCVTGTPIQKGISDLFFLTSFMGMGPLDDKHTWNDFLLKPYLAGCKKPLLSVLSEVFWRSTKDQVIDELGIPDQTFTRHLLNFSAIESYFYGQLHSVNADKFAKRLALSKIDADTSLASLDKSTIKRLLQPLLNLRQACTHAQIVSGINISRQGKVSNLTELLEYLRRNTKTQCDDALREHVASLNGIAGLYWLEGNYQSAVENYRQIIRLSEENKDEVHVDTLQLIHAMTNLAILLEEHPGCAAPTLRDDKLKEQVIELEAKYLAKPENNLLTSISEVNELSKEVENLLGSFEMSPSSWWLPVLLSLHSHEGELIDKFQEQLGSNDHRDKRDAKEFLQSVDSLRKTEIVIARWWKEVSKNHQVATKAVAALREISCDELVKDALECHLRNTKRDKCMLCRVEGKLLDLECKLFATSRKRFKEAAKILDGADTRGSWELHRAARSLFIIFNFAKNRIMLDPVLLQDGKTHMQLMDTMKKEFKKLRAVWTNMNHRVHSQDELSMAKWRFRLAGPYEKIKRRSAQFELALALSTPEEANKMHIIHPDQIPEMMVNLKSNDAFSEFKRKQGRLFYLKNLGKQQDVAPEPCPICRDVLEEFWCVLPCGHCFCPKCLETLKTMSGVECPICRQIAKIMEIFYVKGETEPSKEPEIVGDYSTKVDNVVKQVLHLLADDEKVKILIFSSWTQVLKILNEALTKNKINCLSLPSGKHQRILEEFRNTKQNKVTVLLLPLAWGSKGLNLVEATHVFLIEPILNPAEELQAIGRVHRIGQTRPTVVHRFIMRQTIEENIFEVVSDAKDTWSKNEATLADLKNLFKKT